VVDVSARFAGRAVPGVTDYSVAFLVLALIVLAAVPVSFSLPSAAGRDLSGHGERSAAE
jgi:hypothetical protein